MSKWPYFPFYSKDWIADTAEMSDSAKSILIDLMCYNHVNGDLPSEINKLSLLVRKSEDEFNQFWPEIKKKFQLSNGRLINRKLSTVIVHSEEKSRKNKLIGTFAHVSKQLNLSPKDLKTLKERFNVDELLSSNIEWDTKSLTEWCKNGVPFIEYENESENKNSMKKPSKEDVQAYYVSVCNEKHISVNPLFGETFVNFYTSKGWYVGKNPMKEWKSAVHTWVNKEIKSKPDGFASGQKIIKDDGKKRNY